MMTTKTLTSARIRQNIARFALSAALLAGSASSDAQQAARVKDINPALSLSFGLTPSQILDAGPISGTPRFFFTGADDRNGTELWKSDGTGAGTALVRDIFAGVESSSPAHLVYIGTTVYFTATDGAGGRELWKSDGTLAGTILVKDIAAGARSAAPADLVNLNGTLFFSAFESAGGRELWKATARPRAPSS